MLDLDEEEDEEEGGISGDLDLSNVTDEQDLSGMIENASDDQDMQG